MIQEYGHDNRRALIIKISVILVVFLLICTLISKSIYNILLPTVEIAEVRTAVLNNNYSVNGHICYQNTETISTYGSVTIAKIYVMKGQVLNEGDPIYAVDIENQLVAVKKLGYSDDGIVRAKNTCKVIDVIANEGDAMSAEQAIVTVAPIDSVPCVIWEIPYQTGLGFPEKSTINLTYTVEKVDGGGNTTGEQRKLQLKTFTRELDNKKGTWIYTGKLDKAKDRVSTSVDVLVEMISPNKSYNAIVPISCLNIYAEKSADIFIISKREGLFSEETIVTKCPVSIVDKTNQLAAIESSAIVPGMKAVKYSSKPISDKMAVNILAVEGSK
ncbi:hypothetical protein RBG61_12080 [Paludicola sp. MB14-C6]|uniref:hypothetical protein n=1 Tax=Paludihabitans sp. MB14-C6 TaxID=3070656 RepID=UPI0027DE7B53|nr:hypothetical protein [Paludicola sp. MB14-C6]WMJ22721.1 hypothetical protein RBG61_12080 [Paludicola sp. MB14-C6]